MWEIKQFSNKVILSEPGKQFMKSLELCGDRIFLTWWAQKIINGMKESYKGLALTNLPPSYTHRIFAQSGVRQ